MKLRAPTLRSYMTASPHTVGCDQPLFRAEAIMREHKIRHLPVLEGGQLVGMLSERDVRLVRALHPIEPEEWVVEDAMSNEPYQVSPDEPLDRVAATMAERGYGAAVVAEGGKIVGIFTAIDGLRALSEILCAEAHA
jgi:acetoin utilization protein AcuB